MCVCMRVDLEAVCLSSGVIQARSLIGKRIGEPATL